MLLWLSRSALPSLLLAGIAMLHPHACASTAADDAARVVSELNSLRSASKESKVQFIDRVEPALQRLVATELMAQMLAGDAWTSMASEQRKELTHLYGKMVLSALYGAFNGAAQGFTEAPGELYRSQSGPMKERCNLLAKEDCVYYVVQTRANDVTVEYQILDVNNRWVVVDIFIAKLSLHFAYQAEVRRLLKLGPASLLQELRRHVARY